MSDPPTAWETASEGRTRVAFLLTGAMVAVYAGFLLLIAFDKPLLASEITPGLSTGILLGVVMILFSWVTIFVYVRWVNKNYDPHAPTGDISV